jgi:hypothetical protein
MPYLQGTSQLKSWWHERLSVNSLRRRRVKRVPPAHIQPRIRTWLSSLISQPLLLRTSRMPRDLQTRACGIVVLESTYLLGCQNKGVTMRRLQSPFASTSTRSKRSVPPLVVFLLFIINFTGQTRSCSRWRLGRGCASLQYCLLPRIRCPSPLIAHNLEAIPWTSLWYTWRERVREDNSYAPTV